MSGVSSEDRARWLVVARSARAVAQDVEESSVEHAGDHAGMRLSAIARSVLRLAETVEEMARALP